MDIDPAPIRGRGGQIKAGRSIFFHRQKATFLHVVLASPNLGPPLGLGFSVQGPGSRDKGLGPRVYGLGFREFL